MSNARQSAERAAELAAIIARKCDLPANVIARHVCHLQRMARQAVNISTNLCNIPDYQEIHDKRVYSLTARGNKIAAEIAKAQPGDQLAPGRGGARVHVGGDPRGPCFYLQIDGAKGDGWDPERGYAVY